MFSTFCCILSAEVREEFHPPPTPPDYRSVTKQDFFSNGKIFLSNTIMSKFVMITFNDLVQSFFLYFVRIYFPGTYTSTGMQSDSAYDSGELIVMVGL